MPLWFALGQLALADLESLRAGIGHVLRVQIKKRACRRAVNSGRKKWLCAETDGAIGDRGADGHLI